jgi:DNA recombination protein RmuC
MSVYILIAAVVILGIAVLLFLKKPVAAGGISTEEFQKLKNENTSLSISLAKAEERAENLALERDKADRHSQDERIRYDHLTTALNQDLLAEKPGWPKLRKPLWRSASAWLSRTNPSRISSKNFSWSSKI